MKRLWIAALLGLAAPASTVEVPRHLPFASRMQPSPEASSAFRESERSVSRFDRQAWGLSEQEWARYLALMRGVRGAFSPANLSPLEVLGIHAETEAERREYARRLAELLKQDLERILAFERAYQEAWRELYPDLVPVAFPRPEKTAVASGDRLALFLSLNCETCNRILKDAYAESVQADVPLDLYFTDAKTDRDIFAWAEKQGFDPSRVRAGKLTFNYDRGTLANLFGVSATVPKLLIKRPGGWVVAR